ncbi:hypothetical protein [Xanthomonas campestris]|uniref:hypothetical protein n=1 Tax=Xanthomonas campestris TaxID=339 RepID=UPI0023673564|nr:hypothetical protein [Xanthomonas campestris]WDJ06258.1 hypothetical protein JH261_00760 [Xanthomonas campestris pv. incanae]
MVVDLDKETTGAWIVHHSRKIAVDTVAPSEYFALDEAGKAADLLMRLGETTEATLEKQEVEAIAKAANLNPRTELPHYLELLKRRRLIDISEREIQVLGVTVRSVLSHASDIFNDANPGSHERAAIAIGEIASRSPIKRAEARELIGDFYEMKSGDADDFLSRSAEIGFVDQEGDDSSNTLLFNGNLFKKDSV